MRQVTIYNIPFFADTLADTINVSVCCSDTLLFTLPDSLVKNISADISGFVNDTSYHAIISVSVEDIYSSASDSVHSVVDCGNNVYTNVRITASINPTFIKVIACGNINEDTLRLSVTNDCGGDSIVLILNDNCYNGDSCAELRQSQINQSASRGIGGYMEAYPNPTTGMLNIRFSCEEEDAIYSLSIADVMGRTLMTKEIKGHEGLNNTDLDISNYTSGIYFVNLRSLCMNKMLRITKQ